MRTIVLTLVLTAAALAIHARPAAAYDYPWCAQYTDFSGAMNCGFNTFQQCLATVRGIGGYCVANPRISMSRRGY